MKKKHFLIIAVLALTLVLGAWGFAQADSGELIEINHTGTTSFTIPAGETTAYLVFRGIDQAATYELDVKGVSCDMLYHYYNGYERDEYSLRYADQDSGQYWAETERIFNSDTKVYFTALKSTGDSSETRTFLRFQLDDYQTKDVKITLTIKPHEKHTIVNNEPMTYEPLSDYTHVVHTGSCECGYNYNLQFYIYHVVYTGEPVKPSLSFEFWTNMDDCAWLEPYGGYVSMYEEEDYTVECSENVERGTANGVLTILDPVVAEHLGGACHEFTFGIKDLITSELSTTKYTYTGKNITPKPTVTDEAGKVLTEDTDYWKYLVNYQDYSNVMKKVGLYSLDVQGAGAYTGTYHYELKVVPKKPTIGITTGIGKVTVKFGTKVASTGGEKYQIQYRKVGSATWKSVKTTLQTKSVKSLTKGKKYEIRARAIKTVNGATIYGPWSTVKTSIKVK